MCPLRLAFLTWHNVLKIYPSFACINSPNPYFLKFSVVAHCTDVSSSFHLLMAFWLTTVFIYYKFAMLNHVKVFCRYEIWLQSFSINVDYLNKPFPVPQSKNFLWNKSPSVHLLGHMVVTRVVFKRKCHVISPEWLYQFTFPQAMGRWYSYSAFSCI